MSISPTVPGIAVSKDPAALVAELDLTDKLLLLAGAGTWVLHSIPDIGLRSMAVSDGPIGVRGTGDDRPSAQLPAPSGTAATWDVALQRRIGTLMATEARRKGVDVVLAPVVNLQRSPNGGRHFECYSEDPLLTARLAVGFIEAIQDAGIGACVKHFVGNEIETDRTEYISHIDERTLREVYLAPFEAVVDAGVWTIMAAYNGIARGGLEVTATEHSNLLNDLLKGEWGFDGVVVSDWLATKSTADAANGGLDLVMPGPVGPWQLDRLRAAVENGEIAESVIDEKVVRILRLAERVGALSGIAGVVEPYDATDAAAEPDSPETRALLRELAARSIVVLRNGGVLPLDAASAPTIALIGPNALTPFTQGGGSAFVKAAVVADPLESLRAAIPGAAVTLHRGGSSALAAPPVPVELLTTPDAEPGALIELLDADGVVLDSFIATDTLSLWFPVDDERVASARFVADVAMATPGTHVLEIAPVGAHRIEADGELLSASDRLVGAEVVLDSSYSNPASTRLERLSDGDALVRLDLRLQVVDAVAYGRFVRLHLRHRAPGATVEQEIAEAVAAAASADIAIVVVGTNPETESEGWDRPNLALPGSQNELVRRVAAANPNTVVVVNAGAPVILPWLDDVSAVLWWWLPGQEAGTSLAAALTGAIEPSGRLPWTLPATEADVPVQDALPVGGHVDYPEGVHVGHRGWDRLERTPAREFGFGLGYTTWDYRAAEVEGPNEAGVGAIVRVRIANTGTRAGREVVQVYLSAPTPDPERPVRWLAGFAVVDVAPGAEASVDVVIDRRSFEIFSTDADAFVLAPGGYRAFAGRSSRDLRLETVIVVPDAATHP